ncbi:MAG: UDP-N-acetylmuramoylalanine--D-glutamate ligase [Alphaproteobacteria bacterium RIFCSPLOWO2_01_FULL_40_26]|nr:MAG: UDP-N-acetylmuramoylalanine--D-glutamate ligase [Alphaproteobacteria bacterium RIFCSPHIGHO2_02_FULL_40_34]OFW86732.1 MAG: UDP-N-acetylmuramoylalanine--D-glutamate ligase [Alphaproteobacteria bacterium RIFCSPHIGHO2_01_FULL_40_8]OFW95137.1 MAG: UDP-N-acetylmuramoylalanine--D-glutamate ligase [Alphaproteobacteria bacterium RIFCSPLOWO2_01_FULL_40_26]OFX09139.1 MAG: UDP-N-acetylmuramoylalanine--D-glutamate ligase [Alphaproteobacteria bacterium RIFCSPLOWO2_02_FULL_40_19]OFX12197.1 MAG: UDP-N-
MKYVVYGLGVSGISTIKFLAKNGEDVVATDDNEDSLKENSAKFPQIKFLKSNEIKFDAETIISFAPGIPLYFPKPHKILEIVKKTGAILACDIEIFYRINRDANFIAITGTNGKSTTTALTGFIFKELGITSEIGGNIGVPCFDLPIQTSPSEGRLTYIFETSSYQLDLLSQTHFGIVALLNITPDHLDRHGSMHGYIEAKKRIFRNQIEGDFALIDVDDENSKKIFDELKNDKNFRATLVPISTKKIQENGVSLFDEKLVNKIGKKNSEFELRSEFLHGEHNDQNMAFAFAITHCFLSKHTETSSAQAARSTKHEQIINAITKFRGLHHRMQIVGKIAEIKFINDSKATNAESTKNALKAYENIFWILGGKAKEGGISMLQPYFKKIEKAYLMGEATEDFAQILEKNSVKFEKCRDLKTAFEKAFLDAKKSSLTEKNILLSPACASLDQWKNFEQRGDYFCKLFDELPKS